MAEPEPDLIEEVGGILEGLSGKLPEADFSLNDSSEEDSETEEGGVSVFSRSQHLRVLGLEESDTNSAKQEAEINDKTPAIIGKQSHLADTVSPLASASLSEPSSVATKPREKSSSDDSGLEEAEWSKFKADFDENLRTSVDKVNRSEDEPTANVTSSSEFRQQLLIEAITTLHSSGRSQEGHQGHFDVKPSLISDHTETDDGTKDADNALLSEGTISTSDEQALTSRSSEKSLLSMDTFDIIQESSLDQVLKNIDSAFDSGESGNGDEGSQRSSDPLRPPPKVAWSASDDSGNGALMEELERLSAAQSSKTMTVSTTPGKTLNGPLTGESHDSHEPVMEEKPTIFLDLRPSTHQEDDRTSEKSSGLGFSKLGKMKRESSSESEESDDPYSWVAQRKQIKGNLEGQPLNSTVGSHSNDQQHNLHNTHKLINSGAQGTTSLNEHVVKHERMNQNSLNKIQEVGVTRPHPHVHPKTTKQQVFDKAINTGVAAHKGTITDGKSGEEEKHAKERDSLANGDALSNGVERQRSNDSFTFSSSPSEGEGPTSSEGTATSQSEDQRTSGSNYKGEMSSSNRTTSSGKSKKSSKKQSKKSKKSQKKDKGGQGGQSSSADQHSRSKKISKRRAYILERIRSDSLTSSDEEHCLGSSEMSSSTDSGMSSLLHQDSILEDGDSAVVDVEKLKLHLQRRIMAKKPPTQFETPSTQPLYHEDISFERELTTTKPGKSSEALLVLQICEHGLIAPPEVFSEIDTSAKLGFHLLLLTWLFHATLSVKPSKLLSNDEVNGTTQLEASTESHTNMDDLPFEIVSVQYTILDGNPSFLVGIKVREEDEEREGEGEELQRVHSGGPDTFYDNERSSENPLEVYFQETPLSTLLGSLANNETVQGLLSRTTLEQLTAMLSSPLESVFSFQEDVSPLSTPVSYFWYSGYHPSCLPSNSSLKTRSSLSTTVCSLGAVAGSNVGLVFSILSSIYLNGLDLAGLRLVYGKPSSSIEDSISTVEEVECSDVMKAKLMMAIRGPDSIYHLMDVIGPKDESLAKVTDPHSLTARYGSLLTCDLHCLRTPYSAAAALAKYFGGRACLKSGSILGISDAYTRHERKKRQRVRFSESESAAEELPPSPLLDVSFTPLVTNRQRLIAEPYTKVVMVVSPHIPTSCYSTVLACCDRLGFDVFGVKRLRLNSKRANALNISPSFMVHFTPSSTPPSPIASDFISHPLVFEPTQMAPPLPSCLLVLGRENALLHTLALKASLISDLVGVLKNNPPLRESSKLLTLVEFVDSLFHVTEHSEDLVKYLGHFGISNAVSSIQPRLGSGWDLQDHCQDELCFVTVPQSDSLTKATHFLDRVFHVKPVHENDNISLPHNNITANRQASNGLDASSTEAEEMGEFELLGFKVIPELLRFHAKQLCPVTNNDSQYQEAINLLSDVPATLILFRGIASNRRLRDISGSLKSKSSPLHTNALKQKLQMIVSSSFPDAFRLACIFFSDKELFSDLPCWALSAYVPLSWHEDSHILHRLQHEQEDFFTIVTVSLDQMKTAIKVMDKLSRSGCSFVGVVCLPSREKDVEEVLPVDTGTSSVGGVSSTKGPSIILCVQRVNAVWHVTHILKSFSDAQIMNSHLYCSDGFSSAIADVKQYFPGGLFCRKSSLVTDYQIKQEKQDNFAGLLLPEGSLPPADSGPISYLSPLMETNVMVLPPSLVSKENSAHLSTAGFIDVLDFLTSSAGFRVCGLKMVHLTLLTAGALHAICGDYNNQTQVEDLHSGPSLLVVVQRDNAVACCQMIIKSSLQSARSGGDYLNNLMSKIIFPTDTRKAKQILDLFQQSR